MKTQYDLLGEESLNRLKENTDNANKIQRELLFSLLESNKDTVYGRKYNFADIHSFAEYQQTVPLTDYDDYDSYIQEMLEGTENLLTAQKPAYYCISSGSTGGPKYLPVSETDLRASYYNIYGTVFGMARSYYSHLLPHQIFGKIFQTGEFAKTYTDKGTMNGIRSGALYQWLDSNGDFDTSDYCVPKEVLFPSNLEDLTYVKVRFALAEPNISAIHSVFTHHVVGILAYIERHWELLLRDIALGTVDESISLNNLWREKVKGWLLPNPERANELRRLDKATLADHMVQKLWKNARYIIAIGGHTMERYAGQYARYTAGIPTHHFVYGASEGMIGVANGMDCPDSYIMLPDAGFFEFLPQGHDVGGEPSRPVFSNEVKIGYTYELVYTNLSGLYRYRMKDILRIEGFYGESPIVSFCYRKNQILNVSDEKTNTEQLEAAIRELETITGLRITSYCVQEDYTRVPGRYLCYLECIGHGGRDIADVLDRCLCNANYGYAGCRSFGQIARVKPIYLKEGAFMRYKEMLSLKGRPMGQNKPTRVLLDNESQLFFQLETDSCCEEVLRKNAE